MQDKEITTVINNILMLKSTVHVREFGTTKTSVQSRTVGSDEREEAAMR